MTEWLMANIANIIITAILVIVVACIILKLIRDKKRGISSCGSNCAHCSLSGTCHNRR
ncbi:MAG: FeoB-associated Cys-rich membrane protein [Lachnospiraceae bacterium]|nr:FeoB-associated Cys-rich membrane protein [Lachnospiraceae bacterium]